MSQITNVTSGDNFAMRRFYNAKCNDSTCSLANLNVMKNYKNNLLILISDTRKSGAIFDVSVTVKMPNNTQSLSWQINPKELINVIDTSFNPFITIINVIAFVFSFGMTIVFIRMRFTGTRMVQ